MTTSVYAIATMDTKGAELDFVAQNLIAAGVAVTTVDVGTRESPAVPPSIDRHRVAACHPEGAEAVLGQADRGRAVAAMSVALQAFLLHEHSTRRVAGVIG